MGNTIFGYTIRATPIGSACECSTPAAVPIHAQTAPASTAYGGNDTARGSPGLEGATELHLEV